nr:MAG: hypothetical protein 1 [Leviviridae sp.]
MGNKSRMSALLTGQFITDYTYSDQPALTTSSPQSIGRVGFNRIGKDLLNWRIIIASGGDAHTNLTVTKRKATWTPGWIGRKTSYTFGGKQYWYARYTNHAGITPVTQAGHLAGGALLDVEQNVLVGFLKKIRSEREAWGGQEFIGEFRETINSLRHPMSAMMDLGNDLVDAWSADPCRRQRTPRAYRKCRRQAERRAAKLKRQVPASVGSAWLEFQFGMRPLASMVEAIGQQLTDFIEPGLKKVSYRGSDAKAVSFTRNATDINYANATFSEVHKTEVTHKLRCQIHRTGNIEKGSLEQLRETGFAWDSLVPTAWELLPMSVFIDYVSNIGDLISAGCVSLSGIVNTSQTVITTSTFTRDNVVMVPQVNTLDARNTVTLSFTSPSFTCTEVSIGRGKPFLRVEPRFHLRSPSSGQKLNLAAFAASLLQF